MRAGSSDVVAPCRSLHVSVVCNHFLPVGKACRYSRYPAPASNHLHRLSNTVSATSIDEPTATPGSAVASAAEMQSDAASAALVLQDGSLSIKAGPTVLTDVPEHVFQSPLPNQEGKSAGRTPANGPVAGERAQQGALLGVHSSKGKSSCSDHTLGKLACHRWVASAKNKLWWMTPEWGCTASELPSETQFLLVEVAAGGPYALFLPLIDSNIFRCTLRPDASVTGSSATLVVRADSSDKAVQTDHWDHAVYVAASWDPFALLDTAIPVAASLSGGAKARAGKEQPPTLDLFGWCTWDAFYFTVSARGIGQGLDSLRAGGIPPKWLVIDDGWQMTQLDSELADTVQQQEEAETDLRSELTNGHDSDVGSASGVPQNADSATLANPAGRENGAASPSQEKACTASRPGLPPANGASSVDERFNGPVDTSTGLGLGDVLSVRGAFRLATSPWRTLGLARGLIGDVLNGGQSALFLYANRYALEVPTVAKAVGLLAKGPILRESILGFYARGADHPKRLVSVEANAKFSSMNAGPDEPWQGKKPQLKQVVAQLKSTYELSYVYCWHALAAYWAGVSHQAAPMRRYDPVLQWPVPDAGILEVDPSLAWSSKVLGGVGIAKDTYGLHNEMHTYLEEAGVDGVKVDVQGTLGMCGRGLGGGSALSQQHHASVEESVRTHFPGNHMINCMCHSTEDLYRMEDTLIARCSDDFYPLDPASHTSHVGICAYNSLFMGALIQPDWDMFHSRHQAGLLHATARAISGGPVYVSDAPGNHDFELLKRVVLPDGAVLRAKLPARPTRDCLFSSPLHDGKTALKVWNLNSFGGVVAAFNVQGASWSRTKRAFATHDDSPRTLEAVVRPQDVDTFLQLQEVQRFALYSDRLQRLEVCSLREGLRLRLPPAESDVITIVPIQEQKASSSAVAAIGLTNMLNAGGAITLLEMGASVKQEASLIARIGLRGFGTFLAYASIQPKAVALNGHETSFDWDESQGAVRVEVPAGDMLASEVNIMMP